MFNDNLGPMTTKSLNYYDDMSNDDEITER